MMLILYTSTRSYTNIVSTKMSSSYFSKIIKFISIKGNDEYECPADVIRKLPCRICKCLFLKLPCCIKHVKKVRISSFTVLSLEHATVDLFMDFLLLVPSQNVALVLTLIAIEWKINYCTYMKYISKYIMSPWAKFSALCCWFVRLYDEKRFSCSGWPL